MILISGQVLDEHETAALRSAAAALTFEDGRRTAGLYARDVKRNEQAAASPGQNAVLEKVRSVLAQNALFQSAARPRRYARMAVARYSAGMEYGYHVDDAIIDGSRSDISFTLCLSQSSEYEGGDLIIDDPLEERAVRLDAGQLALYPANTLHRVAPVSSGTRLVVIGWVTSWVADPARRAILFDLDQSASEFYAAGVEGLALNRIHRVRSNLLRLWADG
jgi:PKHD-type hydroxylase